MIEQEKITAKPFPGLRRFETSERRIFFGRDGLSDVLLEKLRATRFVAVVGTSGSGKSSLVRAGLLPALQGGFMMSAGSNWRIALFRPVNNPIGNLAQALFEAGMSPDIKEAAKTDHCAGIEETLRRSSLGLIEVVRRAGMSPDENLLIVVDQFEELYRFEPDTKVEHPKEEASAFVKLLLEAAQQTKLAIYTILTMRSDYLGESAQFWGLPEAINKGQFLIPRMDNDEQREAIIGPVRVFDAKISAPLVNRLLNDAGDNPDQLPILQHAMMRTWDYWQKHRGDSEQIDIKHYDNKEVGGMEHALSLHADEAYNELTEAQQHIAEKMFKRLTEKGTASREGRLPAMLEEIKDITQAEMKDVTTVIEVFRTEGRSFLMPPVPRSLTPDTLIDISHESLIRNWGRLRDWVEEEADSAKVFLRIRDDALRYSKKETGILINPALQIALDWRKKQQPNEVWVKRYSTLEGYKADFKCAMDYLDESKKAHDRAEALKERQRRKSLVILGTMAAVFLTLFLITWVFYRSAESAKANAIIERKRADELRERADELRNLADDKAKTASEAEQSAKNAEAKAVTALETAQEERKKAKVAEATAVERAKEAERLRAEADVALKRGKLLENAIFLPINQGDTNEAIENFKKLQDDYARSGEPSKQVGVEILIGHTILSSADTDKSAALSYFSSALATSQKDSTVNIDPSAFIKIGNSISESTLESIVAIPFYEQAISMLRDDKDAALKAKTLIKMGDIYETEGSTANQYQAAIDKYQQAVKLQKDGTERAETYLKIAEIYLNKSVLQNPNKASSAFNNAIDVYKRIDNLNKVLDTLIHAGREMYGKDNQVAAEYFSQAIGIADSMTDPVTKGDALRNIAYGYLKLDLDRHVKALKLYNEAYKTYHDAVPRSPASFLGEGMALQMIGSIYDGPDQIKAIYYYKMALKSYQQAGSEAKDKESDVKERLEFLENSTTGTQK